MRNAKGFTLLELLIAMFGLSIVVMITTTSFQIILKSISQQAKSIEGTSAGVVGLEIMRADIASAGYGLPWLLQNTPGSAYAEMTALPADGVTATAFNEVTPRAFSSAFRTTTGSAYLVIKSSLAGMTPTARKWSYLPFGATVPASIGAPDPDWAAGDQAIVINATFATDGTPTRQLVMNGSSFAYQTGTVMNASFLPTDPTSTYLVYGVGTTTLSMPWNRVDYFVDMAATTKPLSCNAGSGVLSKAVADQAGGSVTYPLLDCVGDLQVNYYLDMDDDGTAGTYANADGSAITTTEGVAITDVQGTLADPALLRNRLKQIKIYLLAHEGKKDTSFSYPATNANSVIVVGPKNMPSLGRVWTQSALNTAFGSSWANYRWKVYSFTVNLENLL